MAPFYGWGSTASRLQSHYEFPGVPGTQMIDLGRMKGWVDLEPPSGLKPGPLDYKSFHWQNSNFTGLESNAFKWSREFPKGVGSTLHCLDALKICICGGSLH